MLVRKDNHIHRLGHTSSVIWRSKMSGQGQGYPQLGLEYNAAYDMADDLGGDDTTKGPWTPEEDNILRNLVVHHGPKNWTKIAECIPGRTGKSCRLRWLNQLSPDVRSGPFSADEDAVILWAHLQYGNKWALIAKHLPGRTDNHIKNRWNCTLKKRFGRMMDQLRLDPSSATLNIPDIAAMMGQRTPGEGRSSGPGGGPPLAWPLGAGPGPLGLGLGQGQGMGPLGPAAQMLGPGGAGPQGPFGAGPPLGIGPMGQLPLGPREMAGGFGAAGLGGGLGFGGIGMAMGLGGPQGGAPGGLPPGLQQPLMMLMQPPGPQAGLSPRGRALSGPAGPGAGPSGSAGALGDQERLMRLGAGAGAGAFSLYNGGGGPGGSSGNSEDAAQPQEEARGVKRPWAATANSSEEDGTDEGEDTAAMALEQLAHQRGRDPPPRPGGSGNPRRGAGGRRRSNENGGDGEDEEGDGGDRRRGGSGHGRNGAGGGMGANGNQGHGDQGYDGRDEDDGDSDTEARRRRGRSPSGRGRAADGNRGNSGGGGGGVEGERRSDVGRGRGGGLPGMPGGLLALGLGAGDGRNPLGPNPPQPHVGGAGPLGTAASAGAGAAPSEGLTPKHSQQLNLPPLPPHQQQQPRQQHGVGSRGHTTASGPSAPPPGGPGAEAGGEPAGAAAQNGPAGPGSGGAAGLAALAAAGAASGTSGGYGALLVSLPENLMQLSSTLRVVLTAGNVAAAQALISRLEELAYTMLMQRAAYNLAQASTEGDNAADQRHETQQDELQQQQQQATLLSNVVGSGMVDPQTLAHLLLLGGIS